MTQVLRCCTLQSTNEPYIGVDSKCNQAAIFCIQHSPHKNSQGLMHQMLPLKHFKRTLQQKKFSMGQKIGVLIDQYNNLMDALIQEIRELKLRKSIEMSLLWLRQLAKNEQEYELMRQIYRMDFRGLTCQLVHSIYFKIVHNQILEKTPVNEINCYKGISDILDHLSQQKQTRLFLSKKISEIEGILQNGQILRRALPDKAVFKQNIKQVLLQSPHASYMQIKYNKCKVTRSSRQYMSIFSKYPMNPNLLYHINFQTKYTNVMIGVCSESLVKGYNGRQQGVRHQLNESLVQDSQVSMIHEYDKHYSRESVVFNCTNGCLYKDGMFQSGSTLTKGQTDLVLKMRLTSTNQLIIMLGKNILCRAKIDNLLQNSKGQQNRLFLHVLLRTEGDSFQVDRDKEISGDSLVLKMETRDKLEDHPMGDVSLQDSLRQMDIHNLADNDKNGTKELVDYEEIRRRNEEEGINVNRLMDEILAQNMKQPELIHKVSSSSQSYDFRHLSSNNLLGSNNTLSIQQLPKQRPSLKQPARQQIRKFQQKRQQPQPKFADMQKLAQKEKQQKMSQIAKKERIQKILNGIKSKSSPDNNQNNQDSVATRKLREFQERKSSNASLKSDTLKMIKQARNKIQSEEEEMRAMHLLRPAGNERIDVSSSSYQTTEFNLNSPMLRSGDFKPVLIQAKQKQKPFMKSGGKFLSSGQNRFSTSTININVQSQSEDQTFRQQQSQKNKTLNKLRPSQKEFNLSQLDSSFENSIMQPSNVPSLSGAATPIDKIEEFEFTKKSLIMKSSLLKNQTEKKNRKTQDSPKKVTIKLPILDESQENLHHSGVFANTPSPFHNKLSPAKAAYGIDAFDTFNDIKNQFSSNQRNEQSQVIEALSIHHLSENSPTTSIERRKQAAMNRGQISKFNSRQDLDGSNLESSFGGYGINVYSRKELEQEEVNKATAHMRKAIKRESISNIRSQSNSTHNQRSTVQIGNILSPRPPKDLSPESSIIDHSFDREKSKIDISQKIIGINIRKTAR